MRVVFCFLTMMLVLFSSILVMGQTPNLDERLVFAAGDGDLAAVKSLLAQGANVNGGKGGYTPLMAAASVNDNVLENHKAVIITLIAKGANVNAHILQGGNTVLMIAVTDGGPDIVEILIKNSANVNARNTEGLTALSFASNHLAAINRTIKRFGIRGNDIERRSEAEKLVKLLKAAGAK